ncbi:hypothetical protein ACFRMQ_12075 [Kitasatospora sp. NPDC056783]|uniref:hypothetical protein n=1 Tax=Kitasatospora sp. NPDC056783 TaxID=3345943 RepID=UPI0036ACCE86
MDAKSGLTRLTNTGNGSGSGECSQNHCPNIYHAVFEGDINPFIEHQRIALAGSVPFEEYVRSIGT